MARAALRIAHRHGGNIGGGGTSDSERELWKARAARRADHRGRPFPLPGISRGGPPSAAAWRMKREMARGLVSPIPVMLAAHRVEGFKDAAISRRKCPQLHGSSRRPIVRFAVIRGLLQFCGSVAVYFAPLSIAGAGCLAVSFIVDPSRRATPPPVWGNRKVATARWATAGRLQY